MSSWAEAAWTVQRVMQELKFAEKLQKYQADAKQCLENVNNIQNDFNTLYNALLKYDSFEQVCDQIDLSEVKIQTLLGKKFAFIADSNNDGSPIINTEELSQITLDTIWFISSNSSS